MKCTVFTITLLMSCIILCTCKEEKRNSMGVQTKKHKPKAGLAVKQSVANNDTIANSNSEENISEYFQTFERFFEGKDIDRAKLGIGTTKDIIVLDSLIEKDWNTTIEGVNTIIIDGKEMPFEEYTRTCVNAIFPLPDYHGYKVFIIFFEYGDSESWEMLIADKGVIDAKTQRLNIRWTWDDWGADDRENADYYQTEFQIYKDYTICIEGEKRKNGKIKKRTRYHRITKDGKFKEII